MEKVPFALRKSPVEVFNLISGYTPSRGAAYFHHVVFPVGFGYRYHVVFRNAPVQSYLSHGLTGLLGYLLKHCRGLPPIQQWSGSQRPAAKGGEGYYCHIGRLAVGQNASLDVTVKQIEFENSNRYVVAGTGSINLNAATDDIASLTIHQGQHEFQAVVNVQANSDIMVENGSSLAFNNALNLNGNLVRKLGGGLLAINNVMHNDGGSVSVLDGTISGTGEIGGDLNNSTGTVAPGNNLSTLAAKGNVIRATKETLLMESSELTQSPTFSNVVIDFNTSTTVTGTNQEHAVPEPATGTGLLFGALGISVALRIRNACQPVTDSSIS